MSKREIRGLLAGIYHATGDDPVSLHISRSDDGVRLSLLDSEYDIYYTFVLDGDIVKQYSFDAIDFTEEQ